MLPNTKIGLKSIGRALACAAVFGAISSCATVVPPKPLTLEERIHRDNTQGTQIAASFESQLSLKTDIEVSVFFRKIAEKLISGQPELRVAPVGVLLIGDQGGKWRCFSLPGNRVYLSVGLLRGLSYENEIAAAIAFELGHIVKRDALSHWENKIQTQVQAQQVQKGDEREPVDPAKVDYTGVGGLFAFTEDEYIGAAQVAVDLLYKAGYDSRGLISLWTRYKKNLTYSPFEKNTLAKLIDSTRQAIALQSPLRNPVVRSEAFLAVRNRIQNL